MPVPQFAPREPQGGDTPESIRAESEQENSVFHFRPTLHCDQCGYGLFYTATGTVIHPPAHCSRSSKVYLAPKVLLQEILPLKPQTERTGKVDSATERQASQITERLINSGASRSQADGAVRDAIERNKAGKP